LARIKGRKSFLVSDWNRLLLAPEPLTTLPFAPWRPGTIALDEGLTRKALQKEYLWVFRQMNEPLRTDVTPFFWLAEVSTLATCLRNLAGGRQPDESILRESLLNDGIRSMLLEQTNVLAAVAALAADISRYDARFSQLPEIFRHGGSGALEAALYDFCLEYFSSSRIHPLTGRYIAQLIDSRNLIATGKQLRWRLSAGPQLLQGGTIRLSSLQELFSRQDRAGLAALAGRLARRNNETGQQDELEHIILESQGELLCRMAREPGSVGTILDYLWRCSVESRNIGLLSQLGVAGVDAVGEEIHQ
jgi:vacuolar-type H+-ATPase subunit C/Vma6